MRKVIAVLLLVGLLGIASLVHAERNVRLVVNGAEIPCDPTPLIHQDRVFVPVRFVAEAMGAKVGWDGTTSTVHVQSLLTDAEVAQALNAALERRNAALEKAATAKEGVTVAVYGLCQDLNAILMDVYSLPQPASIVGREAVAMMAIHLIAERAFWANMYGVSYAKSQGDASLAAEHEQLAQQWKAVGERIWPALDTQIQVLLSHK